MSPNSIKKMLWQGYTRPDSQNYKVWQQLYAITIYRHYARSSPINTKPEGYILSIKQILKPSTSALVWTGASLGKNCNSSRQCNKWRWHTGHSRYQAEKSKICHRVLASDVKRCVTTFVFGIQFNQVRLEGSKICTSFLSRSSLRDTCHC